MVLIWGKGEGMVAVMRSGPGADSLDCEVEDTVSTGFSCMAWSIAMDCCTTFARSPTSRPSRTAWACSSRLCWGDMQNHLSRQAQITLLLMPRTPVTCRHCCSIRCTRSGVTGGGREGGKGEEERGKRER